MRFSLRQLVVMMALWGLVGWASASLLMARVLELDDGLAPTHFYAVRAALIGAALGAAGAPLWAGGGIARYAVNRSRKWAIRLVQGALIGELFGFVGTLALLYIWPNDAQNTRAEALKWGGYFWVTYWWLLAPASALGGIISAVVAVYVHPSRYLPMPGSEV